MTTSTETPAPPPAEGICPRMERLLTRAICERLLANGRETRATGESDHWPVVKLFTPDAACTWLLTEYDPEWGTFFGLCDLGLGFPELGQVDLAELLALRGKLGLPVERDRHWQARGPLSAYLDAAFAAGHIIQLPAKGA